MREATAPRRLRLPRVLCVGGATLVLAGALLSSVSTEARAAPATPTLTITPGAAGHPYASGQSINISVGPSSRFAAYSRIEILECAAPNRVLPVDDTSCDGNTAQYGSVLVGSDGSFAVPAYTIYQLPNSALGEQANHAPKCDRSQECVLYIGQDQNDFTQPKLFSAAFTVDPSSSPTPSPPAGPAGAGSTGAAAASSGAAGTGPSGTPQPHSSAGATSPADPSAAVSLSPGSSSTPAGVLAYTGIAGLPWLLGIGTLMMLLGTAGTIRGRRTTS
ncbi:MAG TPA: hypothetical protein VG054_07590 [Acidimicrobiales bacterium]|jgi:hypothetical protein|nr:hypothetical protein [Acidimicrobiales bacterium]